MSELTDNLKKVRNNGSRKQAHIDLANECIKEVEALEHQLAEAKKVIWERTGMPMDVIEEKLKEQG